MQTIAEYVIKNRIKSLFSVYSTALFLVVRVRGLCFACLSLRDNCKSSCSKQEGFQGKQFYKESVLFDAILGYYGAANDSRVITTT